MYARFLTLAGLTLLLLTGCPFSRSPDDLLKKALPGNYRDILESPDKFELLTLACPDEVLPEGFDGSDTIRSEYRIVDRREIDDAALRRTLVNAFYEDVKAGEDNVGVACFEPHHGIRATKGSDTVIILVCFMCHNFYVLPDGVKNGIRVPLAALEVWRTEVKRLNMAHVAKCRLNGDPP